MEGCARLARLASWRRGRRPAWWAGSPGSDRRLPWFLRWPRYTRSRARFRTRRTRTKTPTWTRSVCTRPCPPGRVAPAPLVLTSRSGVQSVRVWLKVGIQSFLRNKLLLSPAPCPGLAGLWGALVAHTWRACQGARGWLKQQKHLPPAVQCDSHWPASKRLKCGRCNWRHIQYMFIFTVFSGV